MRVARKICAIEKSNAMTAQRIASVCVSAVAIDKTITLTIMARELTIAQKSTFANKSLVARTGNILAFNAVKPSRVMFVAQKVLVKILKMSNTKSANEKVIFIPIALMINDSNKV